MHFKFFIVNISQMMKKSTILSYYLNSQYDFYEVLNTFIIKTDISIAFYFLDNASLIFANARLGTPNLRF